MTEGHGLHLQFHIIGWDVLAGVVETNGILADEIAKHHLFAVVVEPFPVSSGQSLQEFVVGLVVLDTIGDGICESGVDGGIDVLPVIIDDVIDISSNDLQFGASSSRASQLFAITSTE